MKSILLIIFGFNMLILWAAVTKWSDHLIDEINSK
jgi:hypothetical protein